MSRTDRLFLYLLLINLASCIAPDIVSATQIAKDAPQYVPYMRAAYVGIGVVLIATVYEAFFSNE